MPGLGHQRHRLDKNCYLVELAVVFKTSDEPKLGREDS